MSTYSFSRCWSPKASAIVTSGHVSDEFDPTFDNGEHPTLLSVSQLWDTGAVRTMIARRIATKLNLRPIGMARNITSHSITEVECFRINIVLPNGVELKGITAICDELPDVDMLIGMDIISMCDFIITNSGNQTKFSFRIPGTGSSDIQ